jgi:hypothetical protein
MLLITPLSASKLSKVPLATIMHEWPIRYPGVFIQGSILLLLERNAFQDLIDDRDPRVEMCLACEAYWTSTKDEKDASRPDFFVRRLASLESQLMVEDGIRFDVRVFSSSVRRVIDDWNGGAR